MAKSKKGNKTVINPDERVISVHRTMPIIQADKTQKGNMPEPNTANVIRAKEHVDEVSRL